MMAKYLYSSSIPRLMSKFRLFHPFLSRLIVGAPLLTLLLIDSRSVQAGEWKVREYLRNGSYTNQDWVLDNTYEPDENGEYQTHLASGVDSSLTNTHYYPSYEGPKYKMGYHTYEIVNSAGRFRRRVDNLTRETSESNYNGYNHGSDYASIGFRPLGYSQVFGEPPLTQGASQPTVGGELAVTAVLEWVPRQIHTPDSYQLVDDPNDLPPALSYFGEEASLIGDENFNSAGQGASPWNQENPYHAIDFQFKNLKCPFTPMETNTDPNVDTDELLTVIGASSSYGYCNTVSKIAGTNIYALKNPTRSYVMQGPTRYFAGNITMLSSYFKEANRGKFGGADLNFYYKFKPLSLSFDWDAGQNPVAAGAKTSSVHHANFHLSFKDADNQPMVSASVPKIKTEVLDGGQGLDLVADASVSAKVTLNGAPDADGRVAGTFMSGNRVQTTTIGIRQVPHDPTSGTVASVGIEQTWANVEWRVGDDDTTAWEHLHPWGEPFFLDDDDEGYTRVAYAKLKSNSDKPITPHHFKFLVRKLVVEVTDPTTGDTTIDFFTTNSVEAAQHASDPNTTLHYTPGQEDLSGDVTTYLTPPSAADSDDQGIVKGQFTVKHGDHFVVDSFGFTLQDQDVLTR